MRAEIKDAIDNYVTHHVPTGHFVRAVLENDLFEAVGRADDDNQANLQEICRYVYNEIPWNCWGSPEIVKQWLEAAPAEAGKKE